jgi:hypothetical protein
MRYLARASMSKTPPTCRNMVRMASRSMAKSSLDGRTVPPEIHATM